MVRGKKGGNALFIIVTVLNSLDELLSVGETCNHLGVHKVICSTKYHTNIAFIYLHLDPSILDFSLVKAMLMR